MKNTIAFNLKLAYLYDINLLYFSNDCQHHVISSRLTLTIFLHEAALHFHHGTTGYITLTFLLNITKEEGLLARASRICTPQFLCAYQWLVHGIEKSTLYPTYFVVKSSLKASNTNTRILFSFPVHVLFNSLSIMDIMALDIVTLRFSTIFNSQTVYYDGKTRTPENNTVIGLMRKNNLTAPAHFTTFLLP